MPTEQQPMPTTLPTWKHPPTCRSSEVDEFEIVWTRMSPEVEPEASSISLSPYAHAEMAALWPWYVLTTSLRLQSHTLSAADEPPLQSERECDAKARHLIRSPSPLGSLLTMVSKGAPPWEKRPMAPRADAAASELDMLVHERAVTPPGIGGR